MLVLLRLTLGYEHRRARSDPAAWPVSVVLDPGFPLDFRGQWSRLRRPLGSRRLSESAARDGQIRCV